MTIKSRPDLKPGQKVSCFWCGQEITSETELAITDPCPACGQLY